MRGMLIGLALLGLAFPVRAGVYILNDPHPQLPFQVPPEQVRSVVGQLRTVALPPKAQPDPGDYRPWYAQQVDALERELKNGTLSMEERANLGGCYIRLGQPGKAINLLSAGDRDHFLIRANLASAYFLSGEPERAVIHQEEVLRQWPLVWAGWNGGQNAWYRQCERVFLTLLRARIAEKQRDERDKARGIPAAPKEVDPIFPGVRFVGPGKDGAYAAGRLATEVYDRLPPNAYGIALQLVLWYPQDVRLYWLLAELLNASGNVIAASQIFDEFWTRSEVSSFKDFNQHGRVLKSAAILQKELVPGSNQAQLLAWWLAIPRATFAPPGVGTVADAVGAAAPIEAARLIEQRGRPSLDTAVPPPPNQLLRFSGRHVGVAFGFGFLVAALIAFQWQEVRRRRALASSAPAIDAEEPQPIPVNEPGQKTGIKQGHA
jgi:hypothetical protein